MKRIYLAFSLLLCLLSAAISQPFVPYSQSFSNIALYNPAAAGIQEQINISIFSRREWTTFPGSPTSNMAIADLPINHNRMGIGLRFAQQRVVANDDWQALFMYSYKINLRKGIVSFGIHLGMTQYYFNSSRIAIRDEDDILLSGPSRTYYADFGCGLMYATKTFNIGLASSDLFNHPNNSFHISYTKATIQPNYYLTSSKKWELSTKWGVETTLLAHYEPYKDPFATLSTVASFQMELFIGTNLKSNKTMALLVGINLNKLSTSLEHVRLGYSYDLNFSSLNKYLNNTHEVTLTLKFDKPRSVRSEKEKPSEISPYDL